MTDSANIHATCVARGGQAILLLGDSGSGKSDLALQLIERGYDLVSDDRTEVSVVGRSLVASPPESIAGKLEVRGLGIVEIDYASNIHVALAIELGEPPERLPEAGQVREIAGIAVPLVHIDGRTASAAAKVVLALAMTGAGK